MNMNIIILYSAASSLSSYFMGKLLLRRENSEVILTSEG